MKKVIIFSFLMLLFMVLPVSAWEQSFDILEEDDLLTNWNYSNGGSLVLDGYSSCLKVHSDSGVSAIRVINISKSFDGYFAFDNRKTTTQYEYFYFKILNADGAVIYQSNNLEQPSGWKRHIFVENSLGTGVDYYVNGVLTNSALYTGNNTAGKMQFYLSKPSSWGDTDLLFDDVSTDTGTIFMDNIVSQMDTYQHYKVGYHNVLNGYWYTNLSAPNGTVILRTNVSNSIDYLIPKSTIAEEGTYTLKLYRHDNTLNTDYYYDGDIFTYNLPSGKVITLNKSNYVPGETMRIFTYMPTFEAGNKVSISYQTSSGLTAYTYDILSAEYTKEWKIPENAYGGAYFAYFRDANDNVDTYASYSINGLTRNPTISLDKSSYYNTDTINVFYSYVPIGYKMRATFFKAGQVKYTYTSTISDVVGYAYYTLDGLDTDAVRIEILNNNYESLVSADANILSQTYRYRLSGKVYDAETGAPISGASLVSSSFSITTDDNGNYNVTTMPGNNSISVSATGYHTANFITYVNSVNTNRDFYISPTYVSITGHSLYGIVSDHYTGAAINNARLSIKNGTTVLTEYTHNGQFVFDSSGLQGTWTITVTANGYDTFSKVITVSGDYYYDVKLNPKSGVPASEEYTPPVEVDTTNYSAQPYGAMGRHPFDFNGDGNASADEWKYAFERLIILVGCLCFMGFLGLVGRAGRR